MEQGKREIKTNEELAMEKEKIMYHCLNIIGDKMCGNEIPETKEAEDIFGKTGMCPRCHEEAMREMYAGTKSERALETVVATLGDLLKALRRVEEAIDKLREVRV